MNDTGRLEAFIDQHQPCSKDAYFPVRKAEFEVESYRVRIACFCGATYEGLIPEKSQFGQILLTSIGFDMTVRYDDPITRFLLLAYGRSPYSSQRLRTAETFIRYKLWAIERVRADLEERIAAMPKPKTVPVEPDESVTFKSGGVLIDPAPSETYIRDVQLALDNYLFQLASTKDALAQFVNVALGLEIQADDEAFLKKVVGALKARDITAMDGWARRTGDPWFRKILRCRNRVTHQELLSLRPLVTLDPGHFSDAKFAATELTFESSPGQQEEIGMFVDHAYTAVMDLLAASLEAFSKVLRDTAGEPSQ